MTEPSTDAGATAGATADTNAERLDFEAALEELEQLVESMEGGDLSLDDSLTAFERGVHLTRSCQRALADAELRVRTLIERDDGSLVTTAAQLDTEDDAGPAS